jgi:hypothetical protein
VTVSLHEFEAEAVAVLKDLRRSVARVLGDLQPCVRASELATTMGLDRSLGWKIWTLAQGASTSPSPKHVPGRAGFRTFIEAARQHGASAEHIEEATHAFARFEELSKAHARDRASAEIMLGALTSEGRSRLELSLRRAAFRANTHFLGVQVNTLYQVDLVIPGSEGRMPRVARVRAHYGLTRMRSGVRWVLGRSTLVTPGGATGAYTRRALDGVPPAGGAPVVRAFSSTPTPRVLRRVLDGVVFQDELDAGPVGRAGSTDVVIGELVEDVPHSPEPTDAVTCKISAPCERFCYDVLLHHSIASHGSPRMEAYTTIHTDYPYTLGDRDRIPASETIERMGEAHTAPPMPEVPHHADLIRWMFDACAEDPGAYDLFRYRMRFPPMPTLVAATYRTR